MAEVGHNKISHPLWAIEENVIMSLKLFWLEPPQAPIIADVEARKGKI